MNLFLSIPLLALWFDAGEVGKRLIQLTPVDIAIIAIYFAMVLGIGFYLKHHTKSGEDFFLAGREMTAWVAGLSFVSANLGALELMGWAAAAYQYGILATHWYWIGAIPAILFLGLVLMPFYYISKTHSVPGYLAASFWRVHPRPQRHFLCLHDRSDVGHQHVRDGPGDESRAGLEHPFQHLGFVFDGRRLRRSGRTFLRHLQRGAAILPDLVRSMLIPILGLVETGGWNGLVARIHQNFPEGDYTHLWQGLGHFSANPMGIHWMGIVLGLGFVISFGYWNTDFLVVQRIFAAKDIRAAKMAPIIGSYFKMAVPFIVILPGLLGLAVLPFKLVPGKHGGRGPA